jgi:hypothetical protein
MMNRPAEALAQYENELKLAPNRRIALQGKQKTMEMHASL